MCKRFTCQPIILSLDDDDNEENYVDFVVIEEFHEKFGPAVSSSVNILLQ